MKTLLTIILSLFCGAITAQALEPFRFAVVTDIHIHVGNDAPTADLRNTVRQINADSGIDFVLVTGDIADAGDGKSLELAKQELDRLNKKYYIIEGNHDQNWSESGCTDFERLFGSRRFQFTHKGIHFVGFPTGPMLRMALGHVCKDDISWLRTQLAGAAVQGLPSVVVCHIPMQPQDVDNWYEVTDIARAGKVVAFVNGHYHRNINLTADGIPSVVNITNLRQQGNEAGQYNEIDITTDSVVVYTHPVGQQRYRWMAIPLQTDHKAIGGNLFPRPDFSVNKQYPNVLTAGAQIYDDGFSIFSSPVAWKGNIYVGDDGGQMLCIGKHFNVAWRFAAGARIVGTPAISSGVLVFGSADKLIYGLDARSGKQLWQVKTGKPCLGAVAISGKTAFIGGGDGIFRAIDIKTGKLRWQAAGIEGYVETKPLVAEGKVVFGDWANTLYCLDAATGARLWTWQPPNTTNMHYSPAGVWPVAANGRVFICDPERAMTAIDLNTGRQLWRTKQSKVRESIGISQDGSRVYAKTMQDSIVCYSTEGGSPRELWATDCGFGYEHARTMLVEKDGVCFATTKNGLVIALDGRTGSQLWQHKVGNTLVNTVVPLSKSEVLFTDQGGQVGKITVKEQKQGTK